MLIFDPTDDAILHYQTPNGWPGHCRVRLYREARIVVVTEQPDNQGPSVTNAIEIIADTIERDTGAYFGPAIRPDGSRYEPTQPVWSYVEHYPPRGTLNEAWCTVTFDRDQHGRLVSPSWRSCKPPPVNL